MNSQKVIEVKDVCFSYQEETILDSVNLSVEARDFIAMIGPNGGGKTTLLKLMLGLLHPDSGNISILGKPPGKASGAIGYVPQNVSVNNSFPISVLDVVLMGKIGPRNRLRRLKRLYREEAIETLEKIGMVGYETRKIGELSGGQRQRVFIARALLTQPQLLLLDEPTANVDSEGQLELYKLLKTLNKDMTVIVVSHEWIAISAYVKSVACINKKLHFHKHPEINTEMMDVMYPTSIAEGCPVELVAHGIPHRVLKPHEEMADD